VSKFHLAALRLLAAGAAMTIAFGAAAQQSYPSRPIRLVIPFPPGGGTDVISRIVAAGLTRTAGWTIVADNKSGATGTIGLIEAARASNDGYTIVMGQEANVILAPAIEKNVAIDPLKELTPVTQTTASPLLIMVAANSKYKNLQEVIAIAKAKPGTFTYGNAGIGGSSHLMIELLQIVGDFKMVPVPYKGATPAVTDLLGGHIPMASLSISSGMAHIQAGKVRGIAVTSAKRNPALPDVPTVAEAGYKDFEAMAWLGILVPNGVAPAIITRLNGEIGKVMQDAEVRKALAGQGNEARTSSPEEFAAMLKAESAKWRKVIATAGIAAQ